MNGEKYYLFWEKQSIKEFWKNALFAEKAFVIVWSIYALLFCGIFIGCTMSTDSKLSAAMLFGSVWVFLFFVLPYMGYRVEKSFWVIFEDTYVLRHGSCYGCAWIKKIFYKEARYIVIGNIGPSICPPGTGSKWYHKKWGNYINVWSSDKQILFSVRYSEELLKVLQERCGNAEVIEK